MAVRPMTAGPHLDLIDTGATRRGFGPACFDAVICRRLDPPARRIVFGAGEQRCMPVERTRR
jgi:hypothetical protein